MNIIPSSGTYQGIGLSGELINVDTSEDFTLTIYYDNTNDDDTLNTVGFNLYFYSTSVEFIDFGNYSEEFKNDYIQTQYNTYIGYGLASGQAQSIADGNWTSNYGDDNGIYGSHLKQPNTSNFDAINDFSTIFNQKSKLSNSAITNSESPFVIVSLRLERITLQPESVSLLTSFDPI